MADQMTVSSGTRERLLESAGEIFAEKGFEKATIREIVGRAQANLNAVNYYYRDKRGLYVAVFEYAHRFAAERDRAEFERMRALPPADRVRALVEHVLRGFFSKERKTWQTRLMVREMVEPTRALDIVVDRLIRPRFTEIVAAVRALVGPDVPDLKVQLCAESIVAQCVHISHGRPIVSRLIPDLALNPDGVEALAEHIAEFSLAALRNLPPEGMHV